MFYVYILLSEKTGKFYIGSTGDLEDRLFRHNSGWSKSTKSGRPWQLVYSETFSTRSEAMNVRKKSKVEKVISVYRS